MGTRRLVSLASAVVLAACLAACSPEEEPEPAAPPPVATEDEEAGAKEAEQTEETTPDGDVPDVPPPDPADYPRKDEQTAEGAEQAVRYYWAMTVWGFQTGEHSEIEQLFTEDCVNCVSNFQNIEYVESTGEMWGPTEIQVHDLGTRESDEYDYEVEFDFTIGEHESVLPKSQETEVAPAQTFDSAAGVDWTNDGWVIAAINIEEVSSPDGGV